MENSGQQNVNVVIDANNTPVLYVDSYIISSNEQIVTLNFAQAMPDPKQQQIVARLALTRDQSRQFSKDLKNHIDKFEV